MLLLLLVDHWAGAQFYNQTKLFAEARAGRISQVHYRLALTFQEHAEGFSGTVRIDFHLSTADGDLSLDFAGRSVAEIRCNQQTVDPVLTQQGHLGLPGAFLQKGANSVFVRFTVAYANNGRGLHHFVDPTDGLEYLYTDLQPNMAMRVFPCFDQPDLRAVLSLELNLPNTWTAVANGPLLSARRNNGRTVMRFKPTKPIATYLFNLVAGRYAL